VAGDDSLDEFSNSQDRHCERSEAIHSSVQRKNGLLRRYAPRNDVDTACVGRAKRKRAHHLDLHRHGGHGASAPLPPYEFSNNGPHSRGAISPGLCRNPSHSVMRAQGMPGAQCARSLARKNRKRTSSSHYGHTGNTRHSLRNGFTVSFVLSPVIRIWLTPSSADHSTDLTPTSRRQDHTTSPSAIWRFRQRRHSRPLHPVPRLVTIASRPSVWDGMA
jgi:hypothetical protein